ncbi:MAG TPA: DUF1772 domain-containing protein [Myxococcota bacterium]|nr:DUF1772 domain-containing protein [Myxococcota bacterium]
MVLKTWRLATILLAALSLGAALGHLLELPAKLGYEGPLWLTISQTLYRAFGTVGASFEVGAVLASALLVMLVRGRGHAFVWTLSGALCIAAAHAIYWVVLAPINATVAALTPETLPPDWTALRLRWELAHAARAGLQIAGLAALVSSLLVEIPSGARDPRRRGASLRESPAPGSGAGSLRPRPQ